MANSRETENYIRRVGFDTRWRENWWRKDFLELLGRRLDFQRVEKMLDAGCGAGHWGRLLAHALPGGCLIAGVDKVPAFIDQSLAFAKETGMANFEYAVGDAEALPHDDNSFDLVTCQTLLIHVKEPVVILKEMKRVLRPGGILLLAEPNNLMGFFPLLQCQPRPAPDVMLRQLGFYETCLRGKKAMGWGDTSIGDQLPAMIAALGFTNIQVAQNERQPVLIPPYETEDEQLQIEFLMRMKNDGVWIGFCDDTERFYKEGGGDEAAFPRLLSEAMVWQKEMFDAIEGKTFSGSLSGGFYITAGIKPGV